jgi:hypothetical protein
MVGVECVLWELASHYIDDVAQLVRGIAPPADMNKITKERRWFTQLHPQRFAFLVDLGWPLLTPDLLHRVVELGGNDSRHLVVMLLYKYGYDPLSLDLPTKIYPLGRTPRSLSKRMDVKEILEDAEEKALKKKKTVAKARHLRTVGVAVYQLCKQTKLPREVSSLIQEFVGIGVDECVDYGGLDAVQALDIKKRRKTGKYRVDSRLLGISDKDKKAYYKSIKIKYAN